MIPTRKRLIKERERCSHTQYEFADECGISRQHYSQIETGVKNPSLKTAMKIKETLYKLSRGRIQSDVIWSIEDGRLVITDPLFSNTATHVPLKRGNPNFVRKSEEP